MDTRNFNNQDRAAGHRRSDSDVTMASVKSSSSLDVNKKLDISTLNDLISELPVRTKDLILTFVWMFGKECWYKWYFHGQDKTAMEDAIKYADEYNKKTESVQIIAATIPAPVGTTRWESRIKGVSEATKDAMQLFIASIFDGIEEHMDAQMKDNKSNLPV